MYVRTTVNMLCKRHLVNIHKIRSFKFSNGVNKVLPLTFYRKIERPFQTKALDLKENSKSSELVNDLNGTAKTSKNEEGEGKIVSKSVFLPKFDGTCKCHQHENRYNLKSSNHNWESVYVFSQIRFIRFMSRLKVLQTGLTITLIPLLGYQTYVTETIPFADLVYGIEVAVFAAVMLLVLTRISQRMVMLLYVDNITKKIRISHLTFWGNRTETIVDLDSFEPIGISNQKWNDAYLKLKNQNSQIFYLCPRFAAKVDIKRLISLLD